MSRISFQMRYAAYTFMPPFICLLLSCGGNGGDVGTASVASSHLDIARNQILTTPSLLRQEQLNAPFPESIVGLLTLIWSRPVLSGNASTAEIEYIVNGLSSPVSSFQIEYTESGLPIEASGCQVLMLQSFLDYGLICQGDIPVNKTNTAIRIKLRLQNGRDAYSNNVTLPSS